MKKYKIEILPAAFDDLHYISEYVAQDNLTAANRIVDKLIASLRHLELFPLSAPPVPDIELSEKGYRVLVCEKYLCFYCVADETIFVCHIAHGVRSYPAMLRRLDLEKKEKE